MNTPSLIEETTPFGRVVKEDQQTYLDRVRAHTCYSGVRTGINLITGLSLLGGLALIGSGAKVLAGTGSAGALAEAAAIQSIGAGLASIIGAIVFRFSLILLVDLADLAIDRNRNRWEFPPEG